MAMYQITERILSDAREEARVIVEGAENTAAKLLADASARAEQVKAETEADVKAKRESILEKRAADVRLDSAKRLLAEKRKVIDDVYERALARLCALSKEESLLLADRLLTEYAEEGDEIVFADTFRYQNEVSLLPIVKAKNLRIAPETKHFSGGMRLNGIKADKDISYGALLHADREENQAALAVEIFK